ncbi:MAG: hypothetical protein GF311_09040 [Candidatus Lokiarchaeota archaeon]|nr:hypothetical protein [Candidatus Lokiarchaeota archaeon]
MIFQGLYNILDLYLNDSETFYEKVDSFFKKSIENIPINKNNLQETINAILDELTLQFTELGFSKIQIENKFADPFLNVEDNELEGIYSSLELYREKIAPMVYEIILEKIVDYLVDSGVAQLMLKLKANDLLPLEFIMELKKLKEMLESNPEKMENLRKYINIKGKIIETFRENKCEIERLEDIRDPRDKLQLVYMIYRIINFFHLERLFDFSHMIMYLENNMDEWLTSVPLITLKNPDIYFCGLYLASHLGAKFDKEEVRRFLLELYNEFIDEFDAPIIEATDQIYYFYKAIRLIDVDLYEKEIENLMNADSSFFEREYLMELETSQLVVILKMYKLLGFYEKIDKAKINAILNEIRRRITPEGIVQYRDGIISSEATYYVLFNAYMRDELDYLKKFKILDSVVERVYRNLEIIDFCRNTNFDLVSEIFYSCESLKLFNCIETKEMIYHLARYLFPQTILENGIFSKEIDRKTAKFRHLKVNKLTGQTIY